MRRWILLCAPLALLACSSGAPGGTASSSTDASRADTGAADTSECPCPGTLVCERGFCVRPPSDATGSPSQDTSTGGEDVEPQDDVSTSFQDVTADTSDDAGRDDAGQADACECSDASKKCCDGCHLLPEGRGCAEDGERTTCEPGGCAGTWKHTRTFAECDGTSPTCPEPTKKVLDSENCQEGEWCYPVKGCQESFRRCR